MSTPTPPASATPSRPSGYEPGEYPQLDRSMIPAGLDIAMIWAETTAGVIGDGAEMPWFLPEDLAHFKRSTVGHPVVMGRTSWDALGEYQPLPERTNVVITRREGFEAPGAEVAPSIPEAIELAARYCSPGRNTVWILGGGQVYAQCMPIADRIVVTEVDMVAPERFRVYAPAIDPEAFAKREGPWLTSERGHAVDCAPGLRYRICEWTRR